MTNTNTSLARSNSSRCNPPKQRGRGQLRRGRPGADRSCLQTYFIDLSPRPAATGSEAFPGSRVPDQAAAEARLFLTALGSLMRIRSRAGGAGLGPGLAPHRLLAAPHAALVVWRRPRRGQEDRACARRRRRSALARARVPRVRDCARAPALLSAALQVRVVFGSSSFTVRLQIPFSFREKLSEGRNLGGLIFFQLRDKSYKDDYDTVLCPKLCIDSRG